MQLWDWLSTPSLLASIFQVMGWQVCATHMDFCLKWMSLKSIPGEVKGLQGGVRLNDQCWTCQGWLCQCSICDGCALAEDSLRNPGDLPVRWTRNGEEKGKPTITIVLILLNDFLYRFQHIHKIKSLLSSLQLAKYRNAGSKICSVWNFITCFLYNALQKYLFILLSGVKVLCLYVCKCTIGR